MSVSMNAKTDDLITRFLLGELSDEERTRVEERFLADNEFFEEVLSAEDALMDQYLLGQLSDEHRKRAQTLFHSSPGQKREVQFTRELIASVREAHVENNSTASANSKIGNSARAFSFIPPGLKNFLPHFNATGWVVILLGCLVLMSCILYLYSQKKGWEAQRAAVERSSQEARERLSEEMQGKAELSRQLEIEKEKRAQAEEKAEELAAQMRARKPDKINRPDTITAIILAPTTLERGGNSKALSLKAETGRVQLQLELDEGQRYSQYNVSLTTFDGRRVWSRNSVAASQIKQGRLNLVLPASLLEYEDYKIELKGLSENGDFVHVADYLFKVRR
jgi:hypothetical protein